MARLFCLAFLLTLTFASATPTDKGKGPAEQSFDHDPEVIRLRQRVDSLREALEAFLAGDAYRSLPDPNSLARFTASASDKKQNEAIQAVADEKLEKLEAAEAELAQLLSRLANPNMGFLSHPAAAGGSQWIPPPNGATAAAGTSVPKEADADVAAASRLKHLAYHNDAWVDPTTKKEKTGLKRQCTQLDNIFQQQQRIRQCISAERDARTTNAAQEDLEQTAKATDDAIRAELDLRDGGDADNDGPAPTASGNINNNAGYWQRICSSSWTKQWVRDGFPLWWKTKGLTPSRQFFGNHPGAFQEQQFVRESIQQLLKAGAIRKTDRCPKVVNPLNVVPKPRQPGKFRLILDLRYVNNFVYCPSFTFEKLSALSDVWQQQDLLISVDLTNSYWQLRMRPDAWEYLGFEWDGQYYEFTVLPFGLVSAPWAFSKLMREFSAHLRTMGLRLINYLDDFLFMLGSNMERASRLAREVVQEFRRAGVAVNEAKSHLQPALQQRSLGFLIDSATGSFRIPEDRWLNFQDAVRAALSADRVPARTLARVMGHVSSLALVLRGLNKLFKRECAKCLPSFRSGWNELVVVSGEARAELEFWGSLDPSRLSAPLKPRSDTAVLELSTNASAKGWAGVLRNADGQQTVARSYLSRAERETGSGNRELAAIFYSLESFGAKLDGQEVQLFTDSQNARYIVEGGSRKPHLHAWALKIFWWCWDRAIRLRVTWIPREWNEVADYFSKYTDGADWQLHKAWFAVCDRKWGPHTVDRFATDRNAMLPRFNSLFHCPGTEAINCFSANWRGENNWCNPPFKLIGRVLSHLRSQGAEASIVVPVWPSAVWWPVLCPEPGQFAPFVVGVIVLPHQQPDLFRPGDVASNEYGVGVPRWGVWVVRVSFKKGWRWNNHLKTPK